MSLIFRYFLFTKQVNASKLINGIIYYIKRTPLVGKYISSQAYQMYDVKKFWYQLTFFLSFAVTPFKKVIWLGVFYGLGSYLKTFISGGTFSSILFSMDQTAMLLGGTAWLCLVTFLFQGMSRLSNLLTDKDLSVMFSFRLERQSFVYSSLYMTFLWDWLCYLPAFILMANLFHDPIFAMNLFLSYGIFAFTGEVVKRYSFIHQWKRVIVALVYLLVVVLVSGSLFYHLMIQGGSPVFSTWLGTVGLFFLGIAYWWLLRRFPERNYVAYLVGEASKLAMVVSDMENIYVQEGISMQKKLTLDPLKKVSYEGTKYLNALLFARYRKQLNRSLYWRLGFIFVGGMSLVILSVFSHQSVSNKELINLLPSLFFIMYIASFGKKIVLMSFVNCDLSMLYYPFYREPEMILKGFWYRLKETIKYNGLIASLLFFFFVLAKIFNPMIGSIGIMFLIAFSLISLTLLFSFHELFIYYLLQPFSGDMQIINPVYKMISNGMYFLAYFNLRLNLKGVYYVLFLSIVSLIYVLVGLVIITKKAPQTFRIKD